MNESKSPETIIGSVFERKPGASKKDFGAPRTTAGATPTGFPSVQHRSKSAFSRNREDSLRKGVGSSRSQAPPVPVSSAQRPLSAPLQAPPDQAPSSSSVMASDPEFFREQISRENEARIAGMTEDEIEDEKRQILERFGSRISGVLERARKNRMKKDTDGPRRANGASAPHPPPVDIEAAKQALQNLPEVPISPEERTTGRAQSPPPPALASVPGTRPSSRQSRRLRFAELEPQDVYVYESHPPSPKRSALALLPPTADDKDVVSLGTWSGKMSTSPMNVDEPTPNAEDSSASKAVDVDMASSEPQATERVGDGEDGPEEGTAEYIRRRYFPDLPANDPNLAWMSQSNGDPPDRGPSTSARFDLHGNPIPATVSSQLPTSLGLHHHAEGSNAGYTLDDIFLLSRSTVPAQRTIMFGVLAGIARHLSKLKEGKVVPHMDEFKGKEEELRKRIVAAGAEAINEKGGVGLSALEVVWECTVGWDRDLIAMGLEGIWLESVDGVAIRSLSLEFLLPSFADMLNQNLGAYPHEFLVQVLEIVQRLALENKRTAKEVVETDRLLSGIVRYFLLAPHFQSEGSHPPNPDAITLLISLSKTSSPFPAPLAATLMARSLNFYTTLGTYGLCTNVASTAMVHISRVGEYATSSPSASGALRAAWTRLAETWTTCAVDPHATTPPHDITWSRISAWGWHTDLLKQLDRLPADGRSHWATWGDIWGALATWLEGCKVNGVRGGEKERNDILQPIKASFEQSSRGSTIKAIASNADVLRNAVRLWLAMVPPHIEGSPESPPFDLPIDRISALAASLLSNPVWEVASKGSSEQAYFAVYLRHVSAMLSQYLFLSRRLPAMTRELTPLLKIIGEILRALPTEIEPQGKGAAAVLEPFVRDVVLGKVNDSESEVEDEEETNVEQEVKPRTRLGPLVLSPASIASTTTNMFISPSAGPKSRRHFSGLPLNRDWTLSAMDHLLHSGESPVFKQLPPNWDSDILNRFKLGSYAIDRNEAILGCMKVFMLEHGLEKESVTSTEEVFRDKTVEALMEGLLEPYRFGSSNKPEHPTADLEKVATRFLGTGTPFYQFYTDFVGLYDAISFSHPLFGLLLLPPISMQYAIDYRKLFWCDYPQILKTISIYPNQVLSSNLEEYLYPVEAEPQVIGSLLSAIVKNGAKEFLHLVALHHIAANIWNDLREEGVDGNFNEERGVKLLKAVVDQGDNETVYQVVKYWQCRGRDSIQVPPDCFNADESVLAMRKDWVERAVGIEYAERLGGLLSAN
ncbi:cytoplasmic protein [Ephemerocybe angulata]|uniref:Cytoplasmic protein n=1 Tax=Ephemerocybe angulata TaxID=980116 RepID=A0A8H6M8C5_9AGAR|nr:cytoplasmic protein [Tulosesus angulatus]